MPFVCATPLCPVHEEGQEFDSAGVCDPCDMPYVPLAMMNLIERQPKRGRRGPKWERKLLNETLPPLPELPQRQMPPLPEVPDKGGKVGVKSGGAPILGTPNRKRAGAHGSTQLHRVLDEPIRIERERTGAYVAGAVRRWARYIDKYDVEVDPKTGKLEQRAVSIDDEVVTVDTLFGDNVQLLHEGAGDATSVRERFFEAFANHVEKVPHAALRTKKDGERLLSLADLVGKNNVSLYEQALQEEMASKAYRNGVVMLGVKNYANESALQDWTLPKHFVVGGSSGAGKTFGTRTILRLLIRIGKRDEALSSAFYEVRKTSRVKYIVSVDGGDARAVSQVRLLVLQAALVLGYRGISDLHDHSKKLDIKDYIKAAAFDPGSRVHVAEPRTFSDFTKETYGKIVEDPARAVFCIVNTPPAVIENQGVKRAWFDPAKMSPRLSYIQINNPEPGCESKAYSSDGLEWGARLSENAQAKYVRDCRARGLTPVMVVLNNNAKVNGDKIVYGRPNLGVYFGKPNTRFNTVKLVVRADPVELPGMAEGAMDGVNRQPEKNAPLVEQAKNTKTNLDTSIIVHEKDKGAIWAWDFNSDFTTDTG